MMASTKRRTESGKYIVYHKRYAGCPKAHKGGPYFFQPTGNYSSGDVYSDGYATPTLALEAAEEWEREQPEDEIA